MARTRVTAETVDEMVRRYQAQESAPTIAAALKVNVTTVYYQLRKRGIQIRGIEAAQKVSSEQVAEMVRLFEELQNPAEVARRLGHSHVTVLRHLRKNGHECLVRYGDSIRNEDYFSGGIRSNRAARLLGLLLTDGCVTGNYVKFSSSDRELCEFVQGELGGSTYRHGNSWEWCCGSKRMVADLIQLGCTRRKSWDLAFTFSTVPDEFQDALLLGLIEGDGTVFLSEPRRKWYLSVCTSSQAFRDEFLRKYPMFNCTTIHAGRGLYKTDHFVLNIASKQQLEQLLPRLFLNPTWDFLPLQRKAETAKRILQVMPLNRRGRHKKETLCL